MGVCISLLPAAAKWFTPSTRVKLEYHDCVSEYLQQIANDWRSRAKELAAWTMAHLVNRTDVWGRYIAPKKRKIGADGRLNQAITAPFREERGKVFLQESSLEKHFKAKDGGGVLGVHSTAADFSSRWMAIDIDLHDEDDLSVTAEGNLAAALGWWTRLQEMGFDPLLMDSNGAGGFHLMVVFSSPMDRRSVNAFGVELVSDFAARGLDAAPEIFPSKGVIHHYGNWLRLPGRHHTRPHFTRVWNDEPGLDVKWLEGDDAIQRILTTQLAPAELLKRRGIEAVRKTICLDFDGVIHSYRSPWAGEDVIPNPPILGSSESIARLRKHFRVVVHSVRCASEAGRAAIQRWLDQHGIEVDEICEHKPAAHIYVDDRGVPFHGDWNQTIAAIHEFRR